jgi:hypothetical protein
MERETLAPFLAKSEEIVREDWQKIPLPGPAA